MSQFDQLMHKLLNDRDFATALVTDPDATLQANGVEPTPEMVSALKGLDPAAVQRLATAVHGSSAAAS